MRRGPRRADGGTSSRSRRHVEFIKRHWIIAALTAGILLAVGLFGAFSTRGDNKSQFFTAKVEHGDIREVVEATGTINAVITVQVGSQVSGTIARLYADFNSRVKKGQVVAQIDPALFQGTLEKAKATAVQTRADYVRTDGLTKEGVMSPQQLDLARANADTADAAVSAAQAGVTQAAAQVQQKEAAVTVAQTNLDYTTIHAPIDGTVIARNVDVGQTVAASLQAPTLFTIAQDLTKMQVYASTDESDVGQIRSGQKVTFKVDAYPRETFTGTVSQVRMNSTVVQNVVTYDTIIDFNNPELKLFPGMTAYVSIPVATAANVMKVPNGALRYKPDLSPDDLRALYQKYGIPEGTGQRSQIAKSEPSPGAAATPAETAKSSGPKYDTQIVWKELADNSLAPVRIKTGITDHTFTEMIQELNGDLKAGDDVVTGVAQGRGSANAPRPGGPGVPRGR